MAGNLGKVGADEGSKCANYECTERGVHLCGGCTGVMYCSAACQKVHWKQGGHKQECKRTTSRAPVHSSAATAAAPAAERAGVSHGSCEGVCIICLDKDPTPIQSGCACRGDAGLAHVECRVEAAAHRVKNMKSMDGWWECGTCKEQFTGAMQVGLAETWWTTARHLPEGDIKRLAALSVWQLHRTWRRPSKTKAIMPRPRRRIAEPLKSIRGCWGWSTRTR
jgi:hypothetical protein